MRAYVDTSVAVRVVFGERNPVPLWGKWTEACSSRIWHTEAMRVLERIRVEEKQPEHHLVQLRQALDLLHDHLVIYPLTESILVRAGDSFPTPISTLDAIHLATAIHIRDVVGLDVFLTHDTQLATAATAMGFKVQGGL